MKLSREAREDLKWWIHTLPNCSKRIDNGKITDTIYSDASNFAWGAVYKNQSTGGAWLPNELDFHINSKELLAGYFGLKALFKKTSSHVRMFCDNTTAVQCINKMGSCRSPSCDRIVKLIWEWARENNNFITAAYIPGVENVTADEESRSSHNEDLEWMLDTNLFLECITTLGYRVKVDLFASRLNHQLDAYYSYYPDPDALGVDAFTINWSNIRFYMFPPFCLIAKCLHKVIHDKAKGIIVVPNWPNQIWYSLLMYLLEQTPILLPSSKHTLRHPLQPGLSHPIWRRLDMLVCLISGSNWGKTVTPKRPSTSFRCLGEEAR